MYLNVIVMQVGEGGELSCVHSGSYLHLNVLWALNWLNHMFISAQMIASQWPPSESCEIILKYK